MASSSETLHEDTDKLQPATIDRHRAIVSFMEEMEAVDWYDQRVDAADDEELRAILAHNRDEEKEHAAMVLEWLRRRDPALDRHQRTYLFSERSVLELEADEEEQASSGATRGDAARGGADAAGSLGIGSLRVVKP